VEVAQQQAEAARQEVEEAKRQAIAEARRQVEEAKQAAKIASLTPSQSVPSDNQQSAVQMDPTDIARLLQAHLKRVGCNFGAVDGNWDTGSKKALELFNKHAKTSYDFRLATFRRKIDVSGIEVSWLPQNKTRRGERRARVGLD
jgi:sRNA-binding protein